MDILTLLKEICAVPSVSSNEKALLPLAKRFCSNAQTDNIGNIILKKGAENPSRRILLDAHCDKIGFVVTEILNNGFLRLASVGGIDIRTLYGARVKILSKETLNGVFSTVPPHLQKSGDNSKYAPIDELAVDVGLSKEQVCSIVSLGDIAVFDADFVTLSQNRVCSPALDNSAGVCATLFAFNKLENLKNTEVTLILSSQEELGMRGATAACEKYDAVISVDASFGSYIGAPAQNTAPLGEGAMLGVGPILDKELLQEIIDCAERVSAKYQFEILNGTTGTNADKLSLAPNKTALISIPILNMHSPSEVLDPADLSACAYLIYSFIKEADEK